MSAFVSTAGLAHAQKGPTASADDLTPTFDRARLAFDRKDWKGAEGQYLAAIAQGGLAPSELIEARVRIGIARTTLQRNTEALESFRHAAKIDPNFELPGGSSARAIYLATQAKRERSAIGPLALAVDAPVTTKASTGLVVQAALSQAHVGVTKFLGLTIRDAARTTLHNERVPAAESVRFLVPAKALPLGVRLSVTVDALDEHLNRMATATTASQIDKEREPIPIGPLTVPVPKKPAPAAESTSFWSTPWPYVIGGVIVAAASSVGIYFMLKPADTVTWTPPQFKWTR